MNSAIIASRIRYLLSRTSNPLLDADKSRLISIAIARALSIHFPVPSSAVPSVGVHFTRTFSTPLQEILDKINEALVIDKRGIIDMTAKFYEFRYNLVHKPEEFITALPALALVMPDYFPQDTIRIMEAETNRLRNDQGIVDTQNRTYIEYYNSWFSLMRTIVNALHEDESVKSGLPISN